ncbi:MAG: hypothetical protein M0R30_03795 [Methanoregula sp.]|uniref:hypothetical protein n=1 Tax=Methanoregula sp. TaxID=2052170 RepID=UPI0025DC40C9|nr:hypothetical protein [Methanoregula sp.]MCK9630743.1 hypothetical protein [Methanoregula sp.]
MDAGLLGLYRIAHKEQFKESGVEIILNDSGVSFKGSEKDVQAFLQKAYDRLLKDYYNTSSQSQKEKNAGFYLDTSNGQFIRFPKVKPMGIAGLVKISGQSYKNKGIAKFVKSNESQKKQQYPQLEEKYAHHQDRFEKFLADTKLKPGASLLLDGENIVSPSIHIDKLSGKSKGRCFICGQESHSLSDIGGTVFPFITGSSGVLSFNTIGSSAEKVCWKCDFLAKFVPVTGFYNVSMDTTHIYFPYSASLEKMNDVFQSLTTTKIDDPHLMRNFDNKLGGYFQKPYEQFFTFLYSLYRVLMTKRTSSSADEDDYELDYEALYDVNLNNSPLDFLVVYTESLGDAQMGKMIWPFHESVYLFRLFDHLERNKINISVVMHQLADFEKIKHKQLENATLTRNRVCENILKKQSIVSLVEQHVFRVNKSETQNIWPLNDFVILYEKAIREGDTHMDQKIIDVAVSVGKTIGMSIAPSGKKGKGDLFRLRKTRKPEDFLNEINRIQMKYGTKVSADLYNQGQKMEENFTEFKQFCMIAALNTYNAGNPAPVETGGKVKAEAA